MTIPLGLSVASARALSDFTQSDPLKLRVCSSPQQAEFIETLDRAAYLLMISGNGAGKTDIGAAVTDAFATATPALNCQTIYERDGLNLDGSKGVVVPPRWVRLPELPSPCTGWILIQSYKAAKDGAIAAIEKYLGSWPVHPVYANNNLQELYIRPRWMTGTNWREWSKLVFFAEEGVDPSAGRVDFVWSDEFPDYERWDEMKQRAKGLGSRFVMMITGTPKERERWEPIRKEFPDDRCLNKLWNGHYVIRCSVLDNQALTAEDKRKRIEAAKNSPLELARLYGQYVDVKGSNPFKEHINTLKRWHDQAVAPKLETAIIESDAVGEDGKPFSTISLQYEVMVEPEPDQMYFLIADPSLGIDDDAGEHSPYGITVVSRARDLNDGWPRIPLECARFEGYISPYTGGSLIDVMAKRYNMASVDVDNTGGYGEGTLIRLRQLQYPNIIHYRVTLRPDRPPQEIPGFKITETTRGQNISASQEFFRESAEYDTCRLTHRATIGQFMEAKVDKYGRLIQGAGRHTEFIVCIGRALHLIRTVGCPPLPAQRRKTFGEILRSKMGKRKRKPRAVF